jgi:hypothetical protein
MASRSLGSLLILLSPTLAAQSLQERTVPLNNWSAPRQVRRSQVQTQQRVVTPKFQLSGGVTADVLVFVPIALCRLADTRPSQPYPALGTTPLAPLTPRTLPIAGACGVPIGGIAEAYSLNLTAVPPSGTVGGYLLLYPNPATPIPLIASLTWSPGAAYQTNAVIAVASSDGSVNVVANATTDVVVDINGYYAAATDFNGDTALGRGALASNAPSAAGALFYGSFNTAFGSLALQANTSGNYNTAVGDQALSAAPDGSQNVALGAGAMQSSLAGDNNTAAGYGALSKTSGSSNTAIGGAAGQNLAAGSYNIMIGNEGGSSDDHTIRVGDVQTSTYIAGIWGATPSGGAPVVVNSNGQLGVEAVSSRRYKEDIQDMGDASKGLLRLRPVTFHYKKSDSDGSKPLEYGLIAEEVAGVYPELVVRGKDGQVETVQYAKLPAMLLNELQKQHDHAEEQDRRAEQQARNAEEQTRRIQQQDETIRKLAARLAALELQLTTPTARVTSDKPPFSSADGR